MNDFYTNWVTVYSQLLHAKNAPQHHQAPQSPSPTPAPAQDAPVAMLFSPHPDDECIVGALPLRLSRQAGYRIVNVGVTLGSKPDRRMSRYEELTQACQYLKWELVVPVKTGLDAVTLTQRSDDKVVWQKKVGVLKEIIEQYRPTLCIFPHDDDYHQTHIGVHYLALDALSAAKHHCHVAQTEFWRAMVHPNTLVESSIEEAAILMNALACHVGEIERNPYHLRLTAWMADNVRRAEVLAGQGVAVPAFSFGTLYQRGHYDATVLKVSPPLVLNAKDDITACFSKHAT